MAKLQDRIDELEQDGFDQCRIDGKHIRVKCSQCDALCINGIACHEIGCPNIVKTFKCWQCGCDVRVGQSCGCQDWQGDMDDDEQDDD